jgi:hypothetical protein
MALQGSMLSRAFPTSIDSSVASLTSSTTMPSIAAASMAPLGTSSVAHPIIPDTVAIGPTTHPETPPTKPRMPCVCCWKDVKDLGKHYPKCPYIRGDWTFWASPYIFSNAFHNQEAFAEHVRSYKPDNIHIETATPHHYVTPRTWTAHFREDAMKRQLSNTLYEYFKINPESSDEWRALNDDDMCPNFNNVADIGEVLKECSQLLRSARSGDKEESLIPQLKQIFLIDNEAVTEILARPDLSRERDCKFSVSYTALDSIRPINEVKVKFGGTGFTGAHFAQYQRRQLGSQNQDRYFSMGGVVQVDPASETLGSSNAIPAGGMSNSPFSLGHQAQFMEASSGHVSSGLAGAQYEPQDYLMEDLEFSLPPVFPQTTQQEQGALASPNPNSHASNTVDDVDSWFQDLMAQPPQVFPQMQNVYANANANMTDVHGTFNDWDLHSQPQGPPILQQRQGVHVNASVSNAVGTFDNGNSSFLSQQRQNKTANTAFSAFDFEDRDPFPHRANPTVAGYEAQQHTNHRLHGYYAS